ncbi:hypothetical protein [Vallitalea sp.]|uniref:hypothetical protein n=1 Tax=Vallitalea sp. TaxID=1882829 RepID=UPI0025EC25D7|nr:hypothetical protein [Vallitalea sp.]MCT4686368.1 hypothetical protein [Vallitalea sp.]
MGGKAKLLDPVLLENLYIESIQFKGKSEETSNKIRVLINKVTDPMFMHNIKSDENEKLIESIMTSKQSLEDLLEFLKTTANYIDSTLEGTICHTEQVYGHNNTDGRNSINEQHILKR